MKTNRPLTVVSLLLSLSMAAMEMTVVSTAMPTVVGDLGGIHLYSWVFTGDRKSTRLNSSHGYISYAVFCLKKKKNNVHTGGSSHHLATTLRLRIKAHSSHVLDK